MNLIGTAILENISTRSDGSVKITLGTNEIGSDDAGRLFQFRNKYIKWLITDDNITRLQEEAVKAAEMPETRKRSASSRLRAVLWRLHEQSSIGIDFETFYASEMERIIEEVRSKLD